MGSPMALSHLILGDIERSNSRSPRFQSLVCHKEAKLGHRLFNILIGNHRWTVGLTLKGTSEGLIF